VLGGIDFNEEMVDAARSRGIANAEFKQGEPCASDGHTQLFDVE